MGERTDLSDGVGDRAATIYENGFRRRLEARQIAVGTFLNLTRNPATAMVLADAGFDFVFVDCEHATPNPETVADFCLVARLAGLTPIVRWPKSRLDDVTHPLDTGALGVMVAHVESGREAEQIVRACRYPPTGSRGVSPRNAHTRYEAPPLEAAMHAANSNILLILQIETEQAAAGASAIAQVPGVDGLFAGPVDLSVDLGVAGQVMHPRVRDAVKMTIEAALEAGLACGVQAYDADQAAEWLRLGASFISVSTDAGLLFTASRSVVGKIRDAADALADVPPVARP